MNFQDLIKIETADHYIDTAFRRAKERSDLARQKKSNSRITKSRFIENIRVQTVHGSIRKKLDKILDNFPSIRELPDFYKDLMKVTMDYGDVLDSLKRISWVARKTDELVKISTAKINRCEDLQKINVYRREFYGRINSLMMDIKKELATLENARRIMKSFPSVKTSLPTACIMGFPNVGKTTLMYKLTGSKPEIKGYAFTTKSLNIAYVKKDKKKVQILDTPGTLDRFEKMNNIEKQAQLAIKHCAKLIIYVFDITEPYPMKDQVKLYKKMLQTKKPVLIYLSKTDIIKKADALKFMDKYKVLTTAQLKEKLLKL